MNEEYSADYVAELQIEMHELLNAMSVLAQEFDRLSEYVDRVQILLLDIHKNPFAYDRNMVVELLKFQQQVYLDNERGGMH